MINKKLLLLCVGLFMTTQMIYSQTWMQKPNIPNNIGRGAASSFSIGSKGYFIGGESASGTLTETWEFNTESSSWNQKANYPGNPINKAISFSYNNIGYYGLGWDTTAGSKNFKLYTYNPSTNNWNLISTCNLLNIDTWSVSYFRINDKVYFLSQNNLVYYYDITNNIWGMKNNFPGATRFTGIGFEINGKGYVGTGVNSFGNPYLNDLWEYDATTDSWTQKTSLPSVGRYASFGFSYNGKGYVLGGEKNGNINTNEFWEYSPLSNSWTRLTDYISGNRNYLAGFVVNNSVYSAFGGLGYNVDLNEYGFFSETASSCSVLNGNLEVGLVGYWPFCGNANDESGNGLNGVVNGATLTTDRFGNSNSAYVFDGVNDYISTSYIGELGSNSRSISFWYNSFSNNTDETVFTDYGRNNCGEGFACTLFPSNKPGVDNTCSYIKSNSMTSVNNWNYYTVTYNSSDSPFIYNCKLYINGVLQTSSQSSTLYNINTLNGVNMVFGASRLFDTNSGQFFNGKLDDIGIWNRALTEQEISQLFNQNQCITNITVTDTLIINLGQLSFNYPVTYANNITIYPNPANTQVNISFNNISDLTGGNINIINSLGQQVATTPITLSGTNTTMPLNTWGGTGLYFVQILNAQGIVVDVKKIILQ
ncbi:MAG: T9SS type A sorting domain-containing protein [Flavobacterium sp.]|nr:T9SS type A sorting domain-containing protein [Flavobacterium sp.]